MPVVERRVPVIADERVELEFGTGALKITPGPRPARLRDRPRPRLARADRDRPGRPHERRRAGELAGLTQEEAETASSPGCGEHEPAREARELPPRGRRTATRCKSTHRAADLAAVVAVRWTSWRRRRSRRSRSGRVHVPSAGRSTASHLDWLRASRPDWNVSRQIWWGHQLPIWYCPDGHVDVRRDGSAMRAPSAARPS